MSWIKSTIFVLIVVVMTFPAIQKKLVIIKSRMLEGYFEPSIRPEFSLESFRSGDYQSKLTQHIDRTIGFHNELTRLFNQFDFSLFSIPHAARMIVGKNNYLQADTHIGAYTGQDFLGRRYIEDKVSRLKYLKDYFWNKKRIRILVIMAPGKAFFYPESIPDRFMKNRQGFTNYAYYAEQLQKNGIDVVDFNRYLISLRYSSRRNLYPKTGIHWSSYGAWLCADSLARYLEARLNRAVPRMVLDSLVNEQEARGDDDEMDRVMNLMWKIPVPVMSYPVFHYVYSSRLPKPAALFISDSFYLYWKSVGIIKNTFAREDMWYYDKEVYPDQDTKPTNTAQIGLDSAINRQQLVILMQTNGGYGNLGFGFIDRAYEYYYKGITQVKRLESVFKARPDWMEQMRNKAKEQHFPLEAVIRNEAIAMYNLNLIKISKYHKR